ncbi:hypothetical protein KAU11_07725 [Candidatus Babeliales bacterium]|nr:hypothetical protein [Candidatus Babeliales bacterium]
MARKTFGIEGGIRIYATNSDTDFVDILVGTALPGGDSGFQDDAPLGTLYLRKDGASSTQYQKTGTANSTADWTENGSSSAVIGNWRTEKIRVLTDDTIAVGARNLTTTPFTDDDAPLLVAADFTVGEFAISAAATTPVLMEVTAIAAPSVTFAVAGTALVANDTFIAINYLPDSPGGQEGLAIVNYNGSVMVKIGDVDWEFATGINLSSGYASANGSISSADTVESAIEKLDGNQQDIQSASGIAQGAVDFGTFTDEMLADNQTAKQLFQRLEILLAQFKGKVVTPITTIQAVDSVPHASVKSVKWLLEVFEIATPANKKFYDIIAMTDGVLVDDSDRVLKMGAAFNLTIAVAISGADMVLNVTSTSGGVTATVRRIEVVQSVL